MQKQYPVSSYPAYHSNYETFYLVERFIDPDFSIHQTCSRLISMLLYSLSCSTVLPVRLDELGDRMVADYWQEGLHDRLSKSLEDQTPIELLERSLAEFGNTSARWQETLQQELSANSSHSLNRTHLTHDPYRVRHANDILQSVERVFASGEPLSGRPDTRNLLYGSPVSDFYRTVLLPGVHDLLDEIRFQESLKVRKPRLDHSEFNRIEHELTRLRRTLRRHLNDITLALRLATRLLSGEVI